MEYPHPDTGDMRYNLRDSDKLRVCSIENDIGGRRSLSSEGGAGLRRLDSKGNAQFNSPFMIDGLGTKD